MYRFSCYKLVSVQENTVESTISKNQYPVNLIEQRFRSPHIVLTRPTILNLPSLQDYISLLVAPDAHVSRRSETPVLALRPPTHTCAVVSLVKCNLASGVALVLQARFHVVFAASWSFPVIVYHFPGYWGSCSRPRESAAGLHEKDRRGLHDKEVDKVRQTRLCENIELLDAINVSTSYTRVYLFLSYVDIIPSALPDAKPWQYLGLISSPAKGLHRGCVL
jgi:hypothetical protein